MATVAFKALKIDGFFSESSTFNGQNFGYKSVDDLTANDVDNDGSIRDASAETVTHPGGTSGQAKTFQFNNCTLHYDDGTSVNVGTCFFVRLDDGTVYQIAVESSDSDFEAKSISSLTLGTFGGTFTGWFTDSFDDSLTGANVVCFASGTLIETPNGTVPVERLAIGDLVQTADHGAQPIRWIKQTQVLAVGKTAPVRIRAGAMGGGLPKRDLLVSQQHRILVSSPIIQRMFQKGEVLVPAKKLVPVYGIEISEKIEIVTYVHFLCDRHEIVFAEGVPSESLLLGDQAKKSIGDESLEEVLALFPELRSGNASMEPARHIVRGSAQLKLAERHAKNNRSLLHSWQSFSGSPIIPA